MRYESKPSFFRSIKRFPADKKNKVQDSLQALMDYFEQHKRPFGLGVKHLRGNYWEFRINIRDRIVFYFSEDLVEFIFAGDHDDVLNYLKHN